jgi:hypothetical protein
MVIALPILLERMSGLLPAEKKQVLLDALSRRKPFKMQYPLNFGKHCGDFQMDLSVRPSEVRRSIISSFAGKKANSTPLTNYSQQVNILYIIVSVTGNGLIELILSSSWYIYRVICCDFDTLRYGVFPERDTMAVRFGSHLEPVILELNM